MKVIRVTALVVVAALGTDSFTVDSDVGIGNVFFIVNGKIVGTVSMRRLKDDDCYV